MKKLMLGILASALLFASSCQVFAEEGACESDSGIVSFPEKISLEEIATMSAQELEAMELLPLNMMSRSVDSSYTIPSYTIMQSTTYYCGPAATLQLLYNADAEDEIAGSTNEDKQETLAGSSYLNTDAERATNINNVPGVMNSATGRLRQWVADTIDIEDVTTLSTMSYYTRSNLAYGNGVIFLVIPNSLSYYPQTSTSGHFISCSGIYYNTNSASDYANIELRLNDPHYNTDYFGVHIEPFMNVATAMHNYTIKRSNNNFVY